jgi:hypothetical protein
MELNQIPSTLPLRSVMRSVLTLASMLLLGIVWCMFFLWGIAVTENWVSHSSTQLARWRPDSWQFTLHTVLAARYGSYLPASLLLLTNLLLLFYRLPRVRGRLTVPLEFAVITCLFMLGHGIIYLLLQPSGAGWVAAQPFSDSITGDVQRVLYHNLAEIQLFTTLTMLTALFWFQASGRARYYWRHLRRLFV